MSANNGNPVPLSGTSNQLKKSIGRVIIKINSEILELQKEYQKVKSGGSLSKKGENLEKSVNEKKDALEDALKSFDARKEYVEQENFQKMVDMIKINIATASKVLEEGTEDIPETEVTNAQKQASEAIEEIEQIEVMISDEMSRLTTNLSSLAPVSNVVEEVTIDERSGIANQIERELQHIGQYQADRYHKMKKEIEEKMDFQISILLTKWKEGKEILDYQALKEIRGEFENVHKNLRFMVSEWERRKFSDLLSDNLSDAIAVGFDKYMNEYRRMDEEKRTEAAIQRKKNLQMDEYKREKRRAIPAWPNTLPYNKYKPDILAWDQEHHLSTGSVKFGLLAEMLKNQGRITLYEQIQTRLGKHRNESNIIKQVVLLLDSINEETVYNKLSSAWDAVKTLKKPKEQSVNEFFSKFETIMYSLNLADDSYKELEAVEAGKPLEYYQEREKLAARRVEMNDKLKAVQLIKALGLDGAFKRDILAKVNFDKEPREVYEDTKTAIRDICGEKFEKESSTADTDEDKVLMVKPWQERNGVKRHGERFSRSRERGSRSRSGGHRDRSFQDRSSSYSRRRSEERSDGRKSGERSDSRSRPRRSSVSFQDGSRRRESTPGPGYFTEVAANNSSPESADQE